MGADEEGEAEGTGQAAPNDERCSLLCLIGVVASKDSGDGGQNVRRNREELSPSGGVSEVCDKSTTDPVSFVIQADTEQTYGLKRENE